MAGRKPPRGKRQVDGDGRVTVAGKAPNGMAEPYFDKTRNVWVAPWRRPDGRIGRPTGRTRALAEASRDRHIADAAEAERRPTTRGGFAPDATVAELVAWWLEQVARHRVRPTTFTAYAKQLSAVERALGTMPVRDVKREHLMAFLSHLVDTGSAARARNIRTLLVQVFAEAEQLGLVSDNVARRVRSPKVPDVSRPTLSPEETARMLAACDPRYVGAVALCFLQGWRISEALGLAWQDVDLDAGTAVVRRAMTYQDRVGMVLGPCKTAHTAGENLLSPTVVGFLRARQVAQAADRAKLTKTWPATVYDGERLDLVFTNDGGGPLLRQRIDKALRTACQTVGIDPHGIGTHTGRRSVITNLSEMTDLSARDLATFVGHTDPKTTERYIQRRNDRPKAISRKVFAALDPEASPDTP